MNEYYILMYLLFGLGIAGFVLFLIKSPIEYIKVKHLIELPAIIIICVTCWPAVIAVMALSIMDDSDNKYLDKVLIRFKKPKFKVGQLVTFKHRKKYKAIEAIEERDTCSYYYKIGNITYSEYVLVHDFEVAPEGKLTETLFGD